VIAPNGRTDLLLGEPHKRLPFFQPIEKDMRPAPSPRTSAPSSRIKGIKGVKDQRGQTRLILLYPNVILGHP